MNLSTFLSKSQIEKLSQVGVRSLYDLIITMPLNLEQIESINSDNNDNNFELGNETDNKTKFEWKAKLVQIDQKQGKIKSYYLLKFNDNQKTISGFYFATASFVQKLLQIDTIYDLKMSKKGNFWTIEKLKIADNNISNSDQKNNESKTESKPISKSKIQAKYSQKGILKSAFWEQVHRQIPPQAYILNLQNLVPINSIIPQSINLLGIHKPQDKQEYYNILNQWTAYQVFLKMSLIRYLDRQKQSKVARSANLDIDFLKGLTNTLPFELSISQKQTIWDILQEISEV